MTTAEHAQSARTGTCPTSDELKQYLAGWSDETQSEQLEKHLQLCPICEAAIGQMETRPDTLLQSLQSTVARSVSDRDSSAPDSETSSPAANDPPINAALAKAKQLMDAPIETAADKARTVWQPMQRELGMYELIKPLGRGGMGAVYLASHKQLKKQVAIKLLPILSAEDSDVRARFDREIRVVGKLNHPSIVAATDAGEIDGTQFLVMEYVPGLDLSRLARLMGRLPVADACELIRQAALGLSCAHAEGVVHRDVKPSNLMLDESGRIRILDFGLAQLSVWDEASVDLTTVGQLMGTLDYMAPEQAEVSGGVDYRADLYALGATLFRLLCGRAPLAAAPNQSPFEKLRLLANHQPPKLSTLCPEAPEELVKLVASLLSRNPSDRPASAAHVAEQLAPFAEGSKLVDLLQQAKEKAATSPELLKKSAFADLPQFGSLAPAEPAPMPASSGSGRSKILRRLLLAASLPILIIAGILIKLETSKGQLIIESDVDNVSVKLLKDGKPVDGIKVSHGTTSTRLNADNYEITIDGPSDGLAIDNDKFTLKNGETVVAKIQRESSEKTDSIGKNVEQDQAIGEVEGLKLHDGANTVSLIEKFAVTLEHTNAIERITGVDSQMLAVGKVPGKSNQLRIAALMPGACHFKVADDTMRVFDIHVEVMGDVRHLESVIRRLYPNEQVDVEKISETAVRLAGIVSSEETRTDIQQIAEEHYPTVHMRLKVGEKSLVATPINQAETPHAMSNASATPARLYDGKPLAHWLAALKTDRSPAKQRECLEAIRRLADVADSEEATTSLTEFLRADFGEERDAAADELGFQCIARLNPDQRFLAWWMKEFQTGDEAWQIRLSGLGSHLNFSSGDQLAEFEHWVKIEKAQNKLSPQNVKHVADFVAKIGSTSDCSREVSDRLVQLLDDMTRDDRSWWLAAPHQVRFGKLSDRYEFMQLFAIRSCRITVDVIATPESNTTQIAQAAMVLQSNLNHWPRDPQSANPSEHFRELFTEANQSRFLKAMDDYLKRTLSEPARMTELIKVPREFDTEAKYHDLSKTSRYAIQFSHGMMQGGGLDDPAPDRSANTLMEVLDAIYMYGYYSTQQIGTPNPGQTRWFFVGVELAESVTALRSSLNSSSPQLKFNGPQTIVVLEWPQMTSVGPPFGGVSGAEIWGDHGPTADDWLRLCLLGHEVLNAPVIGEESPDLSASGANPSMLTAQAETPQAMPNAPATSAPLYDGKPLEHWLDTLSREKSAAGLKSALDACSALGAPDNAQKITTALFKVLPTIDGEMRLVLGDRKVKQLDFIAIPLLRKLNKGSTYFELCAREFEAGDRDWQKRLLWKFMDQDNPVDAASDFETLMVWAESHLGQPVSEAADVNEQASEIARFLRSQTVVHRQILDANQIERISTLLKSSPQLRETWWLSYPLIFVERNDISNLWAPQIKAEITRVAVEAVSDNDTDPSLVAQACMILANGAELTNEQKTVVLGSIQRRLEETSQSLETLTLFVAVSDSFREYFVSPTVGKMNELGFVGVRIEADRIGTTSMTLQLLSVASAFDMDKMCQPQLQKIFDVSRDVFEIINVPRQGDPGSLFPQDSGTSRKRRPQISHPPLRLSWPDLSCNVELSAIVRPDTEKGQIAILYRELWGDHNPSKQDWLKYLILFHPAMSEILTGELEKTAGEKLSAASDLGSGTKSPSIPLYEGKPLEHWLDMLSRERSVLGLKAAIDGCTALVAEDNTGAVTDAVLKALPGLDGDLSVNDKETNSVWNLDYEAGDLLRKANPGSKFFEVWVKTRSQSTDKEWNERLLKLANYRKLESPDDVAPLIEWGRAVLTESDKTNSQDPSLDAHAAMDAAVLLRNMSGISYLGMNNPFVDVVAPILTESPKLDDAWWLSEPLMYRGPNGMTELWPAPIKAKISETAVRVLEKAESDSAAIVQACMILANGAVLTKEQKATVLTSIQRRLEDAGKSPETLTEMVPVKGSFSHLNTPSLGNSTGLEFVVLRIQIGSSWAGDVRDTNTSLVLQLLDVVTAIDKDKRCQPQVKMIFESCRDVFEIVNAQRLVDLASREKFQSAQDGRRQRSNPPLDIYWPSLPTNVDVSTPIHPGSAEALNAMAFRILWGEHVPSKQDWMKYLILLHPALKDSVTAEISTINADTNSEKTEDKPVE